MSDLNVFTCCARLGRDVELRTTPSGVSVASVSVALTTGFGDHKGTLWLRAKVFGKRGDAFESNFHKGDAVLLTGNLSMDEWEKDGQQRQQLVMNVSDWSFAPKSGESRPQAADPISRAAGEDTPF